MFVLYARGYRPPDQYPRSHIVKFPEAHQAKVWLTKMEHNLPEGFTITAPRMDDIRAAPDTPFQLTDEYERWILRFKYGTWDEVHAKDEPEVSDAKQSKDRPRVKRDAKAQRPDGYVTITELCASSGVPASDARAILRANFDKPAYGWAFDKKQLPAIKKLVGIK